MATPAEVRFETIKGHAFSTWEAQGIGITEANTLWEAAIEESLQSSLTPYSDAFQAFTLMTLDYRYIGECLGEQARFFVGLAKAKPLTKENGGIISPVDISEMGRDVVTNFATTAIIFDSDAISMYKDRQLRRSLSEARLLEQRRKIT